LRRSEGAFALHWQDAKNQKEKGADMADERDERDENEDGPKIRIVDRRMLSNDERAGKGSGENADGPKLQMIHGGTSAQQNPNDAPDIPSQEPPQGDEGEPYPQGPAPIGEPDDEEEIPLSAEELAEAQAQYEAMEQEQFQALEERIGRPLTEQEKEQVREEMARQAESMTRLEVEPLIQQFVVQMSQLAAVHMGLMPNPYTRLIARNDAQARLAIDSFGALYDVIKPRLDPASDREFARVLNDLRVNFASVTGSPVNTQPSGPRIIH
jgi:hypothetical protein